MTSWKSRVGKGSRRQTKAYIDDEGNTWNPGEPLDLPTVMGAMVDFPSWRIPAGSPWGASMVAELGDGTSGRYTISLVVSPNNSGRENGTVVDSKTMYIGQDDVVKYTFGPYTLRPQTLGEYDVDFVLGNNPDDEFIVGTVTSFTEPDQKNSDYPTNDGSGNSGGDYNNDQSGGSNNQEQPKSGLLSSNTDKALVAGMAGLAMWGLTRKR